MKVLVVGGAGYVGTILRPALHASHDCFCFDRHPVASIGERSIVADVADDEAVRHAVAGKEAVVYLAMGGREGQPLSVQDTDLAFNVNVRDAYRFFRHALRAGVRHFIYASTLSVYADHRKWSPRDETAAPDAWHPYGMSKRLAEHLCLAAAQHCPDAVVIVLRLLNPRNEEKFEKPLDDDQGRILCCMGPNDLRRLFLAALGCDRPGGHVVQTSGDVEGHSYPNTRAGDLLGWQPRGD